MNTLRHSWTYYTTTTEHWTLWYGTKYLAHIIGPERDYELKPFRVAYVFGTTTQPEGLWPAFRTLDEAMVYAESLVALERL